jgi:AcrR family transcriptional regulator
MDRLALTPPTPSGERADAARNRRQLLSTARELMAEVGAARVTMDGLAARAGLGKGTVFRRFGSRAGIFQALLDEEERGLQLAVMSGKPPLGPGAPPRDRLIAYGHARVQFLFDNHEIARASLDGGQPVPTGRESPLSRIHIRMLLGQIRPNVTDLDVLAIQLTAALDGPLLLQLTADELSKPVIARNRRGLKTGWSELIDRICPV